MKFSTGDRGENSKEFDRREEARRQEHERELRDSYRDAMVGIDGPLAKFSSDETIPPETRLSVAQHLAAVTAHVTDCRSEDRLQQLQVGYEVGRNVATSALYRRLLGAFDALPEADRANIVKAVEGVQLHTHYVRPSGAIFTHRSPKEPPSTIIGETSLSPLPAGNQAEEGATPSPQPDANSVPPAPQDPPPPPSAPPSSNQTGSDEEAESITGTESKLGQLGKSVRNLMGGGQ